MNIDFTCQKCTEGFELDSQDVIDGTEKLECPNCGVKATKGQTDDFITALTDFFPAIAAIAKKFGVSMAIDSEEMEEARVAKGGDEADEEEDDVDDEDDDDDDDDEDDDVEDVDDDA